MLVPSPYLPRAGAGFDRAGHGQDRSVGPL